MEPMARSTEPTTFTSRKTCSFLEKASVTQETHDHASIQNYKAHRTLEIVKNARIAYRDPRFGSMPILINECDFRKMPVGSKSPLPNDTTSRPA